MKPVILYVDDDAHNLTIFEASMPEDWTVKTFSNPMKALEKLDQIQPWVIVADQRMPGVKGVEFLEVSKKIVPHAMRVIVTGYSDEDLVIETVRKAQIFDYIRKPWDTDDLEASIKKAVEYYKINFEKEQLHSELLKREEELRMKNKELISLNEKLKKSKLSELQNREELECWAPPFLLEAIQSGVQKFPIRKDLVCITFDIVNSNEIHEKNANGKPIRSLIIQNFSESVIRNGGWRESHSGDSAYAHFGLLKNEGNSFEAALAVAREFRVSLRNLSDVHGVKVECGIAIHLAKNVTVDIHQVQLNTPNGVVTQKSFDTTSNDVDLVHRLEKLAHELKGTNILLTGDFANHLEKIPRGLISVGTKLFKGSKNETEILLIPSDYLKDADIEKFAKQHFKPGEKIQKSMKKAA